LYEDGQIVTMAVQRLRQFKSMHTAQRAAEIRRGGRAEDALTKPFFLGESSRGSSSKAAIQK
jgi:hypothetical protein